MIVFTRKPGEAVVIGGNVTVRVLVKDRKIQLAIDAPKSVSVDREEIDRLKAEGRRCETARTWGPPSPAEVEFFRHPATELNPGRT